jgi:hypothetical protein
MKPFNFNLAAQKRFEASIFGSHEFETLGIHDKASLIFECQDQLDNFSQNTIELLSTLLIKSMCTCSMLEFIPDEITGTDLVFAKTKHTPSCATVRIPVIEDWGPGKLLRRQRRELLMDHRKLMILEENGSAVRKKAKHFNAN